MRNYDTRLGRFISVDPLTRSYPWNSPYAFAENDVIRSIDLDGLEKFSVVEFYNEKGELYKTIITLLGHALIEKNIETIEVYRTEVHYDKYGNVKVYNKGRAVAHTKTDDDGNPIIDPDDAFGNSARQKNQSLQSMLLRRANKKGDQFEMRDPRTNKMKNQGPNVIIKEPGVTTPDPKNSAYVPDNFNAIVDEETPMEYRDLGGIYNVPKMGGDGSTKVITGQPTIDQADHNQKSGSKTITINPSSLP